MDRAAHHLPDWPNVAAGGPGVHPKGGTGQSLLDALLAALIYSFEIAAPDSTMISIFLFLFRCHGTLATLTE